MGHMVDDMIDQAQIAVDEVIPGAGFLPETPVDEFTINVAQRHGAASSQGRRLME
jgi:hypothetical protein